MKFAFSTFFILLVSGAFALDNQVKIGYEDRSGEIEYNYFDRDTEVLDVYKSYVVRLHGLEQLKKLKEVSINRTHYLDRILSFLQGVDRLETLHLNFVTIEKLDFLIGKKYFKNLVIQGCNYSLEVLKLPETTEYIEITNSQLDKIPKIRCTGNNLKQINLAFNKINIFDVDDETWELLSKAKTIILAGNTIKNLPLDLNVSIDRDIFNSLDESYYRFIK